MNTFAIIVTMMIMTSAHATYTDFSGTWSGECVRNGETLKAKKEISQSNEDSIIIAGDTFTLNKPTVLDLSGDDNGEWKEVRVYDWSWNEEKTQIITNVHWLGWYIYQHGTWSGKGNGLIQLQDDHLVMTRNFDQEFNGTSETVAEVCTYSRQ